MSLINPRHQPRLGPSLRNIHLIGAERIDLADHLAVARPRGEDVKAVCQGYRCACWRTCQCSGGRRARGPEDPSQSSSLKKRGWMASGFTVSC
jgi:hypothetical protein